MNIDDLFIKTEVDKSVLAGRPLDSYNDISSFNEACISYSYDLMICFILNSGLTVLDKKYYQNFINRFNDYLNVLYPNHSPEFIEKDRLNIYKAYESRFIWWIRRPEKFEDFLQLTYFVYRFNIHSLDLTKHIDVTGLIVTSKDRNRIYEVGTFVFSIGHLFDVNKERQLNHAIIENINSYFAQFWNSLNQQDQIFSEFYGKEIDTVDAFCRVFSHFATRHFCIMSKQRGLSCTPFTQRFFESAVYSNLQKLFKK